MKLVSTVLGTLLCVASLAAAQVPTPTPTEQRCDSQPTCGAGRDCISPTPFGAPTQTPTPTATPSPTPTATCPAGQGYCSGTCTDTSIDPANCGACGNACGVDQVCVFGTCILGTFTPTPTATSLRMKLRRWAIASWGCPTPAPLATRPCTATKTVLWTLLT